MSQGQLGTIVSWRVPSQVGIDTLRRSLASAGLDETMAGDMAPKNALRRALREMKQGRHITRLREDEQYVYFQLTRVINDAGREIHFDKEAEVGLDKNTGELVSTVDEIKRHAERLLNEHLAKRLTSDLTRLLKRVYDTRNADLVPIREQGGAYFVPDMHSDLVDATRTMLDAIGGKLRQFAVRLGSEDTAESVADSMAEYLQELIADFRDSCADLTKESRRDVVGRREDRIGELRQKLECYRGILAAYAERIGDEIDEAEKTLLARLLAEPSTSSDQSSSEAARKAWETRRAAAAN